MTLVRSCLFAFLLSAIASAFSGCSGMMGALRPDLDDQQMGSNDQPTVGGRWSERGFLSESVPERGDRYGMDVGHAERAPAGMDSRPGNADDTWVDPDRNYQNRRDVSRPMSYADTQNYAPPTQRMYKNGSRATRADFVDESPNEGSLWASDGQTNYYFTKNKIRGVGDIITVTLEDGIIKDVGLEVRRTLNESEKTAELTLAKDRARARLAGANGQTDSVASSQAAANRGPASPTTDASAAKKKEDGSDDVEVTPGDVDVSKSLELKGGDTMMAEITERYPNGNYKIRGTKRVAYRNGAPRMVNLIGVVRGSDIGEDDTVASGKLYEYRLEALR